MQKTIYAVAIVDVFTPHLSLHFMHLCKIHDSEEDGKK